MTHHPECCTKPDLCNGSPGDPTVVIFTNFPQFADASTALICCIPCWNSFEHPSSRMCGLFGVIAHPDFPTAIQPGSPLLPPTPDTTITDKWKRDPKGTRASMRSSLRNLKATDAPSDHQGNADSLNPRSLAAVHTAAARPRSPSISGAAAPATTTSPRPNASDTIDEAARLPATSSHASTVDITQAKCPDGPVGPDDTIGFLSTLERTRVHALAAEVTAAIKASRIAAIASNAAEAHTAFRLGPPEPPSPITTIGTSTAVPHRGVDEASPTISVGTSTAVPHRGVDESQQRNRRHVISATLQARDIQLSELRSLVLDSEVSTSASALGLCADVPSTPLGPCADSKAADSVAPLSPRCVPSDAATRTTRPPSSVPHGPSADISSTPLGPCADSKAADSVAPPSATSAPPATATPTLGTDAAAPDVE
jgi:hypothetical protein